MLADLVGVKGEFSIQIEGFASPIVVLTSYNLTFVLRIVQWILGDCTYEHTFRVTVYARCWFHTLTKDVL